MNIIRSRICSVLLSGVLFAQVVSCKPKDASPDATTNAAFDSSGRALVGLLASNDGKKMQYCSYELQQNGQVVQLNKHAWDVDTSNFFSSLKVGTSAAISATVAGVLGSTAFVGCAVPIALATGGFLTVPISAGCMGVGLLTMGVTTEYSKELFRELSDWDKNKRLAAYYQIIGLNRAESIPHSEYVKMRKELVSSGNSSNLCPNSQSEIAKIKAVVSSYRLP
jgi:hypothetical protein